jgi:hypothetical protein
LVTGPFCYWNPLTGRESVVLRFSGHGSEWGSAVGLTVHGLVVVVSEIRFISSLNNLDQNSPLLSSMHISPQDYTPCTTHFIL